MSWASRRRTIYTGSVLLFFGVVVGGPLAYWYLSTPATCTDGVQNHGETAPDRGGPCPLVDPRTLQPEAILWTRAFKVRDGSYSAVAYVQNANEKVGIAAVRYHFSLYDSQNILIAERDGVTYLMPSAVTPVFAAGIDTGNRIVAHTYFEFTSPLIWERLQNTATVLSVDNKAVSDVSTTPRISADATNSSIADAIDPRFVAVVFDTAGNAIAASQTALPRIAAGESGKIAFTWPHPFSAAVGRVDIIPLMPPAQAE